MAATHGVSGGSNKVQDMRSFTQDLLRNSPDLSVLTHSLVRKKYLAHIGRLSLGPDERLQLKEIVEDELLKVKVEDSDDDDNSPLSALVHSRKLVSPCVQPLLTSTAAKENMPFHSDCPDRQGSVSKSPWKKRKRQCSELEENSDEEDSGMDQKKPPPRCALKRSSKKAENTKVTSEDSACKGKKFSRSGGGRDSSVEMEKRKSGVGRREVGREEEMSEEEDSDPEKPPKAPGSSSKCDRARKRMSGLSQKGRGAQRRSSSSSEEDTGVSINQKIKAATRSSRSEKDRMVSANKKRKTAMRNSSSSSEEDRRETPDKKGKTVRKSSGGSEEDEKESPNKKGKTVRKSSGSSSGSEEDEKESPNKKGKTVRKSSGNSSGSEGEREKRASSSSCSEEDMGKSPNKEERMSNSSSEVDQGKQPSNSSSEEVRKKRKKERSSSSTKEKTSGGRSEAQKGDQQQGSSLEDSDNASEEEIQKNQKGKKEAKSGAANEKNSGKDEHPSIRRLKRCISACGVRRNYKKLFEGKRSVKAKLEVLKKELEDLGVKGNPTLEKCKILRLKREEAAELASLDTSNIISSEGRLRRRNIWNPYQTPLDTSLGENYKRSVDSDSDEGEHPPKKRLMEWSNLKGLISDSGDSD